MYILLIFIDLFIIYFYPRTHMGATVPSTNEQ